MMGTRKALLAGVCGAAMALAAGLAAADENTGFYLGGSLGMSDIQTKDSIDLGGEIRNFKLDDDDFAWKAFVGYQFLPWLAVEGGYVDFGEVSAKSDGLSADLALDGWDAFVVGNLPIWIIDVFAKVGVISWDADAKLAFGDERFGGSDSGEDIAYGVGAALDLQHFAIRAEVEMFDVDGADDVYLFTVGASIQF